jgi:hypothetical protein
VGQIPINQSGRQAAHTPGISAATFPVSCTFRPGKYTMSTCSTDCRSSLPRSM